MPRQKTGTDFASHLDRRTTLQIGACALATTMLPSDVSVASTSTVHLRLMATTDLHGYVRSFDYFRDKPDLSVGLARVATLIHKAREEVPLSLLFDNGDFLQGTPLSDEAARNASIAPHPVIAAFNTLKYDAVAIGNHEFNFGLPALTRVLSQMNCPILSANIESVGNNATVPFLSSILIRRKVLVQDRETVSLTVGVLGLTPPQIMRWDREMLVGRVTAHPIMQSAEREAAALRRAGADIIVALAHTGMASHSPDMTENVGEALRASGWFDALFLGHTHRLVALSGSSATGAPTVMAGFWGSHLGLIDLGLTRDSGRWQVQDRKVELRPISSRTENTITSLVEEDPIIIAGVAASHDATRQAMGTSWAKLTYTISSREILLGGSSILDLVHLAQRRAAERLVEGTAFAGLPIVSAAAAFKAGGLGGPSNYVYWRAGELTLRNLADLYGFPNRLTLLILTGAQLGAWLEMSAGIFSQLKQNDSIQPLLDDAVPPYQFDVIDGLDWRIDLSNPRRFDRLGRIESDLPGRIRNITLSGAPLEPDARLVLATNHFRADGGGNFPVPPGAPRIDAPDYIRDLIEAMFRGSVIRKPQKRGGWQFVRVPGATMVAFDGHPATRISARRHMPLAPGEMLQNGMRRFLIDFSNLPLT